MFSKDLPVRFDGLNFACCKSELTGLADLESNKALWGRITCEAPLSAIAIGFISLTGTKLLFEDTVATCCWCHSEVRFSCPRMGCLPGIEALHGLYVLYDWSQEGMILGLYMGNSLRLYGEALPDVFLPSSCQVCDVSLLPRGQKGIWPERTLTLKF